MHEKNIKKLFILPATIIILILSIYPSIFSLYISFTNTRLMGGPARPRFIGLENWHRMIADPSFWITLRNTLVFALVAVSLQYVLGFGLALCMNHEFRAKRFYRLVLILPIMVSPVAVAFVIGRMMFSENYGPVNDLVTSLGISPIPWLTNPRLAMVSLILVDSWQWIPFMMLILLAGLESLPIELMEAAKVEGASNIQIFRYIIFPLLFPLSTTIMLIRLIESFKIIDIVRVVTGGGPGQATESVTLYVYDIGVKFGDIGYAAAVAYALLFLVVAVGTIFLSVTRRYSWRET